MTVGELEVASIALERAGDTDNRTLYIMTEGPRQSSLDWTDIFPLRPVKLASGLHVDDPWGEWFVFANVYCFDPPVFIIRAKSFETAYGVFCDEFASKAGLLVNETDTADYPEDERDYNGNGEHIDTSNVQGFQVQFVAAFNY